MLVGSEIGVKEEGCAIQVVQISTWFLCSVPRVTLCDLSIPLSSSLSLLTTMAGGLNLVDLNTGLYPCGCDLLASLDGGLAETFDGGTGTVDLLSNSCMLENHITVCT